MKCKRCNGRIINSSDGISCANCGFTPVQEERVYSHAINTLIAQPTSVRIDTSYGKPQIRVA